MDNDLVYDEALRDPEANWRFYLVVILVVGVLIAGTGFLRLAEWRMEDCVALAGTDAACPHGPGTGLLIVGSVLIAISVIGLVRHRHCRR